MRRHRRFVEKFCLIACALALSTAPHAQAQTAEILEADATYEMTVTAPLVVSGGSVTTAVINGVTYKIHTFSSSGTLAISGGNLAVEYLMIGGGGSGGVRYTSASSGAGSGGGAGGLLHNMGSPISLAPGSYPVVVGVGGAARLIPGGGAIGIAGASGGNSTAFGFVALGGGAGESSTSGTAGGSGGGGANGSSGGLGTTGQGNKGGSAVGGTYANGVWFSAAGGGGGAGAVGGNATNSTTTSIGGKGGNGLQLNFDGNLKNYAGGGGGAASGSTATVSPGGAGAGGGSEGKINGSSLAGTDGLGGGSGGVATTNTIYGSGKGGDGIVIVRYPAP